MDHKVKTFFAIILFGMGLSITPVFADSNEGPNTYFKWNDQEIGIPLNKVLFQSRIPNTLNANLENPIVYGALYESIASPEYRDDTDISLGKTSFISRTQEDSQNAVVGDPFYYEQTR